MTKLNISVAKNTLENTRFESFPVFLQVNFEKIYVLCIFFTILLNINQNFFLFRCRRIAPVYGKVICTSHLRSQPASEPHIISYTQSEITVPHLLLNIVFSSFHFLPNPYFKRLFQCFYSKLMHLQWYIWMADVIKR